ncbi:hypothetical protein DPMN_110726 [Dreissena polymorpha]|uniref:Uncharacterized protein n=1 Tax=Dreissena polymorpha TaxID=45954 RepID=A0A9D4KD45_DREPO|nr:hypothetical protein DPMN_110726 [Dreissena polymorpha]
MSLPSSHFVEISSSSHILLKNRVYDIHTGLHISLKRFCVYAIRSSKFAVLQLFDGADDLLRGSAALDLQIARRWRNFRWVRWSWPAE